MLKKIKVKVNIVLTILLTFTTNLSIAGLIEGSIFNNLPPSEVTSSQFIFEQVSGTVKNINLHTVQGGIMTGNHVRIFNRNLLDFNGFYQSTFYWNGNDIQHDLGTQFLVPFDNIDGFAFYMDLITNGQNMVNQIHLNKEEYYDCPPTREHCLTSSTSWYQSMTSPYFDVKYEASIGNIAFNMYITNIIPGKRNGSMNFKNGFIDIPDLSPNDPTTVPEPNTLYIFSLTLISLLLFKLSGTRKRKLKKGKY